MPISITRSAKAPKLRFHPGDFLQKKKGKSLWCVIACYRTLQAPHEWIFLLEARANREDPATGLSAACQALSGTRRPGYSPTSSETGGSHTGTPGGRGLRPRGQNPHQQQNPSQRI